MERTERKTVDELCCNIDIVPDMISTIWSCALRSKKDLLALKDEELSGIECTVENLRQYAASQTENRTAPTVLAKAIVTGVESASDGKFSVTYDVAETIESYEESNDIPRGAQELFHNYHRALNIREGLQEMMSS